MIDYITGQVKATTEKTATLDVNGFGFMLTLPQPQNLTLEKTITLFTYMHWNQDKGPSFYGFATELERKVFLLIIDCPKIGPSIAMSALSQLRPGQFLEIITAQDEKALSSINGIGTKKAEQMIVQLKHKVQKLISSGDIETESQENFVQWQQVSEVLISLNYSKAEINKAMSYISEKHHSENSSLDKLIRSALSYLSGNI